MASPDDPTEVPASRRMGARTLHNLRRLVQASEDDTVVPAEDEVSDNDVKLARIRAGNTRLLIIGTIAVIIVALGVFGGVPVAVNFFGAEASVHSAEEPSTP